MIDPDHAETMGDSPEGRLGAELRRLRVQAGLSLRALGEELHRGHSTISDLERGRRLPGVDVIEQYEDYFGLVRGTLGAQRERARAAALESPPDGTVAEQLGDVVCPYKGLRAFECDDAALFYGRETQIERVLERLAETRFVAVIGASGSGKSSFVRAGLLAALTAPASNGAAGARVALLTPGEHPVDALAGAISAADGGTGVLAEELRDDPSRLQRATRHVGDGGLVIAVDQFEELFTLCHDDAERRLFVDALIAAWRDPTSPVVVIVALRADFYGRVAAFAELAAAVVAHQTLIGPMSTMDLRRAIELPAANNGLLLQPGLVDTILEDLAGEPGALPLLSHALLETCKRRRRLTLTIGGYREAGGVRGAIAQTAEHTLQSLPEDDRAIAQTIFLSLTDLAEGAEPTRRRIDRAELAARPRSAERLDRVLAILTDARLVTIDEQTVVVAHEALIGHWPRLRSWIDADRAGLLIHRRLTAAAREWDKLEREVAALYRGARLATATEWTSEHPDHLSELERDFLEASQAAEQHEREAAKRRTRRLRALANALAALTLIVATLAVWALGQRSDAQNERRDARKQTAEALSLALAASALQMLNSRPDVSLLLALEANRANPRPEARSSALAALAASRDRGLRAILHGHRGRVSSVVCSPDGRTLASVDGNTIRLWDARTHKPLGRALNAHTDDVAEVGFIDDGGRLASVGDDGTIRLWDVRTHTQLRSAVIARPRIVHGVAFSRDGRTLASASADKTIRLWDTRTHRERGAALAGHTDFVFSVAFSPDGRTLASASADKTIRLWDTRTHKQIGAPLSTRDTGGRVDNLTFSPDGHILADARVNAVRLWDVRTHQQLGPPLTHTDFVFSVAFSPDGRTLASAGAGKTIRLWDTRTYRQLEALTGHTAGVSSVAFTPDGRTLASGSQDQTIRLWNVPTRTVLRTGLAGHTRDVRSVALSADGRTLASASDDKTIRLWDTRTHRQVSAPLRGHKSVIGSLAFSRDGRLLASAGDRAVRLWDTRAQQLISTLRGHRHSVSSLAFSRDGRTLASGDHDATVRLWDTRAHKQVGATLRGHRSAVGRLAFSPDGRTLASADEDGTRLWDTDAHKQMGATLRGHRSPVRSVAFSPDGRTLASAGEDGTRLWDTRTYKQLGQPLAIHPDSSVSSAAFSPDGRTLASAGGTVRLWDTRTQKLLGVPLRSNVSFVGVAFSPDGRTLATVEADSTVRLWEKILWRTFAELQTDVCKLVGTGLSTIEWEQYAAGIPYRQSCP